MSSNKLKQLFPATRRQRFTLLLVLMLALVVGFVVSYALTSKTDDQITANNTDTSGGTNNLARLADKDGKTVYEVGLGTENNEPVDLLIKKDEYIQFNSKDGGEHQIIQGVATKEHGPTGHTPSPLDSGVIKGDEGYLLQFKNTGKYEFHDNYDHDFTITVIVYDPSKSAEDIKLKR